MTRICVIGDSHLASPWNAWRGGLAANYPDVELTFFGTGSDSLKHLTVSGDKLVTDNEQVRKNLMMTSGSEHGEIPVALFDGILMHGLYRTAHPIGCLFFMDGSSAKGEGHFSRGFKRRFVQEEFDTWLMGRTLALVRSVTNIPVLLAPQPYISESILSIEDKKQHSHYANSMRHFDPQELAWHWSVVAETAAKHSAELLLQADETISQSCFTKHEFSVGSTQLSANTDARHGEDDVMHMNANFGRLLLCAAIPRLQEMIAARA